MLHVSTGIQTVKLTKSNANSRWLEGNAHSHHAARVKIERWCLFLFWCCKKLEVGMRLVLCILFAHHACGYWKMRKLGFHESGQIRRTSSHLTIWWLVKPTWVCFRFLNYLRFVQIHVIRGFNYVLCSTIWMVCNGMMIPNDDHMKKHGWIIGFTLNDSEFAYWNRTISFW